ncbi:MAG: DUF434 domain-containing protein [Fervidicoccaceae archaeon]
MSEAARDLYYLLNRGYPKKSSLQLVGSRYRLTKTELALLGRCVHEEEYNLSVARKLEVGSSAKLLVVDVYNVLTSVSEYLEGGKLYLCTDLVIRDIASAEGRSRKTREALLRAASRLSEALGSTNVEALIFVLDERRSRSAELAASLRKLPWPVAEARFLLSQKADSSIIEKCSEEPERAAATSDRVVLERVEAARDLVRLVVEHEGGFEKILDLRDLVL